MNDRRASKVLLIVEDQLFLAMALKHELEDHGYQVLELATCNQEAMGLAQAVKPDLALVNMELARGDDGVALAADLKAMGISVLFISGQSERARSARSVGVGSLPKPYTPSELVAAVDYLLQHEHGDKARRKPPRLEMFAAVSTR
jgi:DNA-binding response OmpR family regulator